jgi:hypothetical protein
MKSFFIGLLVGASLTAIVSTWVFLYQPIQFGLPILDETNRKFEEIPVELEIYEEEGKIVYNINRGKTLSKEKLKERVDRILEIYSPQIFMVLFSATLSRHEIYKFTDDLGIPRENIVGYSNCRRYMVGIIESNSNTEQDSSANPLPPSAPEDR